MICALVNNFTICDVRSIEACITSREPPSQIAKIASDLQI